jgi:spore coat protein CotH
MKRQKDIAGIYERNYTELPDGQYVKNTDLENMKKESPLLYSEVMKRGSSALTELENLRDTDSGEYFKKLKDYGMVPEKSVLTGTLPDGGLQFIQYGPEGDNKKLREEYAKAEKALSDKVYELVTANPDMSAEERGKILERRRKQSASMNSRQLSKISLPRNKSFCQV